MKNIFVLYFILSPLFFVGCSHDRPYRIGVSQCSDDDWRMKMNDEIYREMMFHPEAEVTVLSANDDNDKQISDIRYFIENDYDIIVAAPNEADALTPVISEAYNKGIPVLLFDRKINGEDFTAFQGVNNVEIGKEAANYIMGLGNDKANLVEIYGLPGSTPAIERHKGFLEIIQQNEGIEIGNTLFGNWNYDDTYRLADSLFKKDKSIDVVFAHNDRMAIAASDAAKKNGVHPIIVGIDGAPEIGMKAVAEGKINATFLYPTEGQHLVRTALAILNNEPYQRNFDIPVSSAIDISNADIFLQQNNELKEETEKMELLKTQVDEYWEKHNAQGSFLIAVIVILLLSFAVIFFVLRAFWINKRHHEQLAAKNSTLEKQRDELVSLNEQLKDATQSKLVFFTNVSHDLRTPLTLISEPVEQLAAAKNLDSRQRELIKIADKNVRILKRLINQILDFRKYENNKMPVALQEVNFSELVIEWVDAFRSMAKKRHIDLSVNIENGREYNLALDSEKMERVFFNILSNAFKYTPDNGKITVKLWKNDSKQLYFSISDTGEGISKEDIGKIFDRFYRVENLNPQGSGIGLALTKAFVELHGGEVIVESVQGEGSQFTVRLPIIHVAQEVEKVQKRIHEEDVNKELGQEYKDDIAFDDKKPLMLVIDDNEDIRQLVSSIMDEDYNVITAVNGLQGLRLATKYVPDIIICDVMMPVMDGMECSRKLKEEVSTSHIPILMLTACSMDEQKVKGFENGADGYVSKPFNSEVLKSQCRMLVNNRKLARNVLGISKGIEEKDERSKITEKNNTSIVNNIDNEFYKKFIELVKANMGDPALNVDKLASELGLARSQFYRKIKALTNYSPVELLRLMRLKQARELLTTTEKSISEIGYEVGFSSAAYFTKCYRDEFDETPSQLRERLGH